MAEPGAGLSAGLCVVLSPLVELGMMSYLGIVARAVGVDPLGDDAIYRVCLPARAMEGLVNVSE
eukprot:14936132-Alexandrium_andersonii.AAC.1